MNKLNKLTKNVIKLLTVATITGSIYWFMEFIFKSIANDGTITHWSMTALSGVCVALIGLLDEHRTIRIPLLIQGLFGAILVTIGEGLVGLIVNVNLGLSVWDYSNMPFPFFYDQCCLTFSSIWYVLSIVGIVVDNLIRRKIFKEPKVKYRWW